MGRDMIFQSVWYVRPVQAQSACPCAQSDQSLRKSLDYSMIVKLLNELHFEFLSLKGGCTGLSESTLVKMPHCWKSRVTALTWFSTQKYGIQGDVVSKNSCMKYFLYKKWLFYHGDGYLSPYCCMNNLYISHRSLYASSGRQRYNLNKLGRVSQDDATYKIPRLLA